MTIYDTSIYIDKINKHEKIIDEFAVVEFNIYELLKNKDPKHQKEEFYKLDNFVQENNGTYLLSDNFYEKTRLLNSANTPKQYKFKICLKICNKVLMDLIILCIQIITTMIQIVVLIEKDVDFSHNTMSFNKRENRDVVTINDSLYNIENLIDKSELHKLAKNIFICDKKEIDSWFVSFYNYIAKKINKELYNTKINIIKSKYINRNDLFNNHSYKITNEQIEKYISILVISNDIKPAIKLVTKLIASVLVDNKSFRFNHITDLYIEYIAKIVDNKSGEAPSLDKKRIIW